MDRQQPYTVCALQRGSCFRLVAVADRQTCPRPSCRHGAVQAMTCRNSTSPVGRMRSSPPKCLSSEGPMDPLLPTRFQGTQSKPCPPRTETRRQRMLWIGAVVSLLRLLPLFSPPRQTTLTSRATRKLEDSKPLKHAAPMHVQRQYRRHLSANRLRAPLLALLT
jgi:hypothetical protein